MTFVLGFEEQGTIGRRKPDKCHQPQNAGQMAEIRLQEGQEPCESGSEYAKIIHDGCTICSQNPTCVAQRCTAHNREGHRADRTSHLGGLRPCGPWIAHDLIQTSRESPKRGQVIGSTKHKSLRVGRIRCRTPNAIRRSWRLRPAVHQGGEGDEPETEKRGSLPAARLP